MKSTSKQLVNHEDLERYRIFQRPVTVKQLGVVIATELRIVEHSESAVMMDDGGRYLKATCEFWF